MAVNVNFVVQINGKKRAILNTNRRYRSKHDILEEIIKNSEISEFIEDRDIKRSILVPNRIIDMIAIMCMDKKKFFSFVQCC